MGDLGRAGRAVLHTRNEVTDGTPRHAMAAIAVPATENDPR